MRRSVLAFDLGGTKLEGAIVDPKGALSGVLREPVKSEDGPLGVVEQIASLGKRLLKGQKPLGVGVASAGPLDPKTGVLLDPTNLTSQGKSWGVFALAAELQKRFNCNVYLENDAAASVLAEAWLGKAAGCQNAMVLTLGTGLGTGIICNGALVRSGRGLHPEAGHVFLHASDKTAVCGCGNYGCAESYLSASHFASRFAPAVSAKDWAELARQGDKTALASFDQYARWLALAICNYVVLYAPELVILAGSFSEASDLYLTQTQDNLKGLLSRRRAGVDLMPKILVSSLENHSGVLGAARVVFLKKAQERPKPRTRGYTRGAKKR